MQESSVIQHFLQQGIERGLEQGIERGARDSLIEGILEILELRFSASALSQVVSALGRIQSLPRLKVLRREAVQTESLGAFQEALERSRGSNANVSA